ncbi:MAG: DUF3556 domain-containing protein [Myxococcota bacterium]
MPVLAPKPTPYDPDEWQELPLEERGRLACQAWAVDGYGTPWGAYVFYFVKAVLYVLGWALFCGLSPELGGLGSIGEWWLKPVAFEKAILFSMLFEGVGLGCGSGPLTARYFPPVGGPLYFLRPGTIKLPLIPAIGGGNRRTYLDVALYAAWVTVMLYALIAPSASGGVLLAILILSAVMGVRDRTLLLAQRAEHYWVTIFVFAAAAYMGENAIAGAMCVQLALWFWAGVSKLNHHFPSVVCVMTSNSPVAGRWMRRRVYRDFPNDLRPSRMATVMAHMGTVLELAVPIAFLIAWNRPSLLVAMALMLLLHGYITSSVPVGVPIEWNIMVVYGAFALFWAHPEVSPFDLQSPVVMLVLLLTCVGLPLFGNLFPSRLSFLFSMRYYAGNWAYSAWLFRKGSHAKLTKLIKSAPWVADQLERIYDARTVRGILSKALGFRMMHLHGRALAKLIPKSACDLCEYDYMDGEIIAGLALGWNFGDGHLHSERLMEAIQERCAFEPGELRAIFVESQPLGGRSQRYRIVDAATGELEAGEVTIEELRATQPWSASPAE